MRPGRGPCCWMRLRSSWSPLAASTCRTASGRSGRTRRPRPRSCSARARRTRTPTSSRCGSRRAVPVLRVDSDRDHDDDLVWDGAELTIVRGGRTYLPRVVWTRLYAPAGRPGDQHAREQTAARAANLAALPGALTINPGARLADAPNRVAQLAFAAAHGFRTPRSLVTHTPPRGGRRRGQGRRTTLLRA